MNEQKKKNFKLKEGPITKLISAIVFMIILVIMLSGKAQAADRYEEFYELNDGVITRILPETTVKDLKNNLENPCIIVKDSEGNTLSDNDLVGTGMTLTENTPESNNTYSLSVIGDVDGNGKITITDATKINLHKNNLKQLEDKYIKSADINNDGKITITDLVQMNLIVVKIKDIIAPESFTPTATNTDSAITISGQTTDKSGQDVEYFFKLDDGDWVQNPNKTNSSYTFNNVDFSNLHFVIMKVKDKNGNEKKTEPIIIGENNITIIHMQNPQEWTNKDVTIAFSVENNVTNSTLYISVDNWETSEKGQNTISVGGNGTVKAKVWKKQLGVLAEDEVEITNIDNLAPNAFVPTVITESNTITIQAATTDADATDKSGKSGIKEYEYILKNGGVEQKEKTTQNSYTFTELTGTGMYQITVIARDNAGNVKTNEGKTKDENGQVTEVAIETEFGYTLTYEYDNATSGNDNATKKVVYNEAYGDLAEPQRTYFISYETDGGTSVESDRISYVFGGWYKDQLFENRVTRDTVVETAMDHSIYAKWEEKAVRLPDTEKEGYTFGGWYENAEFTGQRKEIGDTIVPSRDMTFYAKWNIINYSISYELNGQDVEIEDNPDTYTIEDDLTLNNPTRTGYDFLGWTGSNGTTPQTDITILAGTIGNKTYEANWQAKRFTLTYEPVGGTLAEQSITEDYNTQITIAEPTRLGYTFEGWYDNLNYEGERKMNGDTFRITKNTILYAKWTITEYTITYNTGIDEPVENPETYTIEDTITLVNPIKLGYNFLGWTGSNGTTPQTQVTIQKGTTGNKEYTGNWDTIKYRIDYILNGGTVTNPGNYTAISDEITLNNPTKPGYEFVGWTGSNGSKPEKSVKIATGSYGDKQYEANWRLENYTITYNLDGGSLIDVENPINYNINSESFTLNNPAKAGYNFLGWTGSNGTNPEMEVTVTAGSTGNKTFTANWEAKKYTLTFDAKEGTVDEESVSDYYGTDITLPIPTKTGYTFMGWYDNEEYTGALIAEGFITITKNQTLYAKWEVNEYVVTYVYNGATRNTRTKAKTVEYGGTYGTLVTPVQQHKVKYVYNDGRDNTTDNVTYQFLGWYAEPEFINKVDTNTTVTKAGNHNLYAKWGTATATLPEVGERENYNFIGWYTTSAFTGTQYQVGQEIAVKRDITMYAKWKGIDFDLYYEYNGATGGNIEGGVKTVTYGEPYSDLPEPIKEYTITYDLGDDGVQEETAEYAFDGWYLDEDLTDPIIEGDTLITPPTVEGEHYIYAAWDGSDIELLEPEEKYGYEFIGWFETSDLTGDDYYEAGDNFEPTGDKTFYGKWEKKKTILTIDPNGGTYEGATLSAEEYVGITLKVVEPVKTGFEFDGWEVTDGDGTIENGIFTFGMEDTTIEAKWRMITYQITYDLDGGEVTVDNPTEYTDITPNITLNNPTKDGYSFAGWVGSNGNEPSKNVVIKQGSVGNRNYTAKWMRNKSSITVNSNGGTFNVTNTTGSPTLITDSETFTQEYESTLLITTPTKQSDTEETKYTIAYNGNGGTPAKQSDESAKIVTTMYSFAGWEKSSPFYGSIVTGDDDYTYTFGKDDGVTSTITALYTSNKTNTTTSVSLPTATKQYTITLNNNYEGSVNGEATSTYTLDGWYTTATDGTKIGNAGASYTPTESTTLYAYWTAEPTTLPEPTRTGYDFDGWYTAATSGTKVNNEYVATMNTTLYAHWKAKTYIVTFNPNGGRINEGTAEVMYGGYYGELPTPTRRGHEFEGWFTDATAGEQVTTLTKVTEADSHTLYAHWNGVSCVLTYNANGGTVDPDSKPIDDIDTYGELPEPTRPGYTFKGWYSNIKGGMKITESTELIKDTSHTIYAQWNANRYTATLDYNNATDYDAANTTIPLTYGKNYGTLPTPKKAGYTFDGWFIKLNTNTIYGEKITSDSVVNVTGDIELIAKFTGSKIKVTYNCNEGYTIDDERETTAYEYVGGRVQNAPEVYRPGCEFDGWYTMPEGGNKVNMSSLKQTKDFTAYAHWIIPPIYAKIYTDGTLTLSSQENTTLSGKTLSYDLGNIQGKENYRFGYYNIVKVCDDNGDYSQYKNNKPEGGSYVIGCIVDQYGEEIPINNINVIGRDSYWKYYYTDSIGRSAHTDAESYIWTSDFIPTNSMKVESNYTYGLQYTVYLVNNCINYQVNTVNVLDEIYPIGKMDWFVDGSGIREIINLSNINLSNVTNMSNMFRKCKSLTNIDLRGLDTSNVTNMSNMFEGCSSLVSVNLTGLDTSNVIDMSNMFNGCSSLSYLYLTDINTDNVENMTNMFKNCENLVNLDISSFNTSKVRDMSYMFNNCSSLTDLDLSSFTTNRVEDMKYMFSGCSGLTGLDLSSFTTYGVINMSHMFDECSNLREIDLSGFNTVNTINMEYMFRNCSNLRQLDLSTFNTKKIETDKYYDYYSSRVSDYGNSEGSRTYGGYIYAYYYTINRNMFMGCTQLANILVSSNWTIGNRMFIGELVTDGYGRQNDGYVDVELA